jgi:hypothetical protein
VSTDIAVRSKLLLKIPVRMRTRFGTIDSKLVVGPFDDELSARTWEVEFARGIIDEQKTPLGYVEARSVYGRGIHAVVGKPRAEISWAPPGKNPLRPDKHYIVFEGKIEPMGNIPTVPTINANKVQAMGAGQNLAQYITQAMQLA